MAALGWKADASLIVIPGLTRDPPCFFRGRIKDKAGPGSSPG